LAASSIEIAVDAIIGDETMLVAQTSKCRDVCDFMLPPFLERYNSITQKVKEVTCK
jgi:hypothetical protein